MCFVYTSLQWHDKRLMLSLKWLNVISTLCRGGEGAELEGEGKELQKQHILAFLCVLSLPKQDWALQQLLNECRKESIGIVMLSGGSLSTSHALVQGHVPAPTKTSHGQAPSGDTSTSPLPIDRLAPSGLSCMLSMP